MLATVYRRVSPVRGRPLAWVNPPFLAALGPVSGIAVAYSAKPAAAKTPSDMKAASQPRAVHRQDLEQIRQPRQANAIAVFRKIEH